MLKSEREKMLAEKPIIPLFIKLAIPSIIGMVVMALYNFVDRYFIGNIPTTGKLAIGGVGVTMPIMFVLMGVSMLFGIGGGANISIQLGKQNHVKAERVLGNAISMLLISGLIVNTTLLIFTEPAVKLFGATPQNLPYALAYIKIILIGNYWNTFAFGMNHTARAEGNSKRAMFGMLIGAISNVVLDALFIRVFHWGVVGAASATIIAQFLSFIWISSYYLFNKSTVKFSLKNMVIDKQIVYLIVAIGFSPFFIQLAGAIVGAVLNNTLSTYGGHLAQGAYAIVNAIAMLFLMPIFGMNQAIQPIIGYNYGAKNYDRVIRANNVGIFAATVVMIIGWLVVQYLTYPLISLMTQSAELIDITVIGIRGFLLMLPLVGIQIINTTFFQSIGKAKVSFILSISRQLLLLIPLLLILPRIWGLSGIWYSRQIADVVAFIFSLGMMLRQYRIFLRLKSENLSV